LLEFKARALVGQRRRVVKNTYERTACCCVDGRHDEVSRYGAASHGRRSFTCRDAKIHPRQSRVFTHRSLRVTSPLSGLPAPPSPSRLYPCGSRPQLSRRDNPTDVRRCRERTVVRRAHDALCCSARTVRREMGDGRHGRVVREFANFRSGQRAE